MRTHRARSFSFPVSQVIISTAILVISGLLPPSVARGQSPPPAQRAAVSARYGRLPMSFEPDLGQTDPLVKFLSRGPGYTLFLTQREAVLSLRRTSPQSKVEGRDPLATRHTPLATSLVRLSLAGANPAPRVTGEEPQPGKSNYFLGRDPAKWRTNVPHFGRVRYEDVYPGTSLAYYGNGQQLEYDFVLAPGADPKAIALEIETGNSKLENRNSKIAIDARGDLVIKLDGGEIRFRKPVVYQPKLTVDSQQLTAESFGNSRFKIQDPTPIEGRYVLSAGNRVRFEIGKYDRTRTLVIDPVLSYSTYLGGTALDAGYAIAVDSSGDAYVAGSTYSTDFPTQGPEQSTLAGIADAFVTKLSPDGATLLYSTFVGGSGTDRANALALDSSGDVYVTGSTDSLDFPTTTGVLKTTAPGNTDAFVFKLDPTGAKLTYSTYLGGSGADVGEGIAIDSSGDAFVAGSTQSTDFPTAAAFQGTSPGGTKGFVSELNPTAASLVYSTYLGGTGTDFATSIAVDGTGSAYVAGLTTSTDFPVTAGAFETTAPGGGGDAFVAKFKPDGSGLVYATYLGGSGLDRADALAIDSTGAAYVTGLTQSLNFPVTGTAFQLVAPGNNDAFVAKVDPTGAILVYATYLGGADAEEGFAIGVDSSGNAYVAGQTQSSDFPVLNAVQSAPGGGTCGTSVCPDGFVTVVNSTGTGLVYSTYLGGSGSDGAFALAVDGASGNAWVTGSTASADFPVIVGAEQYTPGGGTLTGDAFVTEIAAASGAAVRMMPLTLKFSSQATGTTSASQAVTLTNFGTATLTFSSIVASTNFGETDNCTAGVAGGGASCTINVTFQPTTTGDLTGTLTITDSAGGSPQVVNLTGTGTTPAPAVTFNPTSLTFSDQAFQTTSAPQTATITNSGSATLNISSIAAAGDFAETNNCPASLNPGTACTVSVTFTPSTTGSISNSLTVTDDATGSPQKLSLSGTGVAVYSLAVNPASAPTDPAATSQTFTISLSAPSTFTDTVNLTCSAASPAKCTLSPTSIAGSTTSTLTVTSFAGSLSNSLAITVTGTDGSQTATASSTVLLMNFSLSMTPMLQTITAGDTTTYTLTVMPVNSSNQQVTLTCPTTVNLPKDTTCTVSPGSVTLDGVNPQTATVTLQTTANAFTAPPAGPSGPPPVIWLLVFGSALTMAAALALRRRLPRYVLPLAALVLLASLATSCDTYFTPIVQGTVPGKGTPGGVYTITMTGTVGKLSQVASSRLAVGNTPTSTTP